jgi:hypothetical protein
MGSSTYPSFSNGFEISNKINDKFSKEYTSAAVEQFSNATFINCTSTYHLSFLRDVFYLLQSHQKL